MSQLLQLVWGRYLGQLQAHPLRTKALTAAAIAGFSDHISQRIRFNKHQHFRRTWAVVLYGLIWNGPSAHFWQKWMEKFFGGKSDLLTVIKKMIFDQLTYGPLCNVLLLSYATIVLEGRSFADLRAKLQADWLRTQVAGWKLWPLASLINYGLVPLQFRVLFINIVSLFWSTFLLLRSRTTPLQPTQGKECGKQE